MRWMVLLLGAALFIGGVYVFASAVTVMHQIVGAVAVAGAMAGISGYAVAETIEDLRDDLKRRAGEGK